MGIFEIILAVTLSICGIIFFLFVIVPLTLLGSVELFVSISNKIDDIKLKKKNNKAIK